MFRSQLPDEQTYAAAAQAGFGCPRGMWGAIIGYAMAWTHRSTTAWTLDLNPDGHILEIGFGPGTAIREAAYLATRGFIAGIDPSTVLLQQAARRNREAVLQDSIELRLATTSAIPYPSHRFDKIFGTNSIHFSRALASDLAEIHRMLRPGGLAAFSTQPMWQGGTDASALSIGHNLRDAMAEAGFRDCRIEEKDAWPRKRVCVLGRE